jgi:lysyl-tRNA synthetase class I
MPNIKTAISIEKPVFDQVNDLAKNIKISQSRLFVIAAQEFIELLNENTVRYFVVGGYAVAFHGHPRYTKDLDVWIELSPDNAY